MTPGMRTSEFLVTVATAVGMVLAGAENWLPNRYAGVLAALASVAYAISRGLAKTEPRNPSVPPGPPNA